MKYIVLIALLAGSMQLTLCMTSGKQTHTFDQQQATKGVQESLVASSYLAPAGAALYCFYDAIKKWNQGKRKDAGLNAALGALLLPVSAHQINKYGKSGFQAFKRAFGQHKGNEPAEKKAEQSWKRGTGYGLLSLAGLVGLTSSAVLSGACAWQVVSGKTLKKEKLDSPGKKALALKAVGFASLIPAFVHMMVDFGKKSYNHLKPEEKIQQNTTEKA